MPVTRMRMRPWLEKQIESENIPGLSWVNKEEMIFQIPWKHAARHGWDMDRDASLFRSWAIHTGRYKLGEKEPDPKTWKANFRCAMNSLPDIKEVKDRSIYKGCSAVRVYKMLPTAIKTEKKERKPKSQKDSKGKPRKKVESLSADEVEEAVKNCTVLDDHSSYTLADFSVQEATGSSDLEIMQSEINTSMSSWNEAMDFSVPDSTTDPYTFQVSPMPSSSEGDEEDISAQDILALLESNPNWSINDRQYYPSDPGTGNTFVSNSSFVYTGDEISLGEIQVRVTTDFTLPELTALTCL